MTKGGFRSTNPSGLGPPVPELLIRAGAGDAHEVGAIRLHGLDISLVSACAATENNVRSVGRERTPRLSTGAGDDDRRGRAVRADQEQVPFSFGQDGAVGASVAPEAHLLVEQPRLTGAVEVHGE